MRMNFTRVKRKVRITFFHPDKKNIIIFISTPTARTEISCTRRTVITYNGHRSNRVWGEF